MSNSIRDRIISALDITPMTVGAFVKAMGPADMVEERGIWEVVQVMERDGEIRCSVNSQRRNMIQLTGKVTACQD